MVVENVSVILANRLRNPLNAYPNGLTHVRQMVSFISEARGSKSQAEIQQDMTGTCEGLAAMPGKLVITDWGSSVTPGYNLILRLLGYATNAGSLAIPQGPLSIPDKVIAAISVDMSDLVLTLLPQLTRFNGWTSPVFGPILLAAMGRPGVFMVDTILRWLEQPRAPGLSLDVGEISADWGLNLIEMAIPHAICAYDVDMLQTLVTFHDKNLPPLVERTYAAWLQLSFESKDVALLDVLLRMRLKGRVRVTKETLMTAGYLASTEQMVALLATEKMHADKKFANTSPLIVSIRGGRVDVIAAVLDAGADVDLKVGKGAKEMSPMDVILRTSEVRDVRQAIAQLLLDRGATVPHQDTWARSNGYPALRQILEATREKRKKAS